MMLKNLYIKENNHHLKIEKYINNLVAYLIKLRGVNMKFLKKFVKKYVTKFFKKQLTL